ncbi:MAG TPA: PilZ domain-containing protein, partial [Kofleriaceae bacterium]|nr:PilZ domain-containing protein [Kofleriaceae bacterium]
ARLSDVDRRRFYDSYLNSYEVQIEDLDDGAVAAAELLRRLGGAAPRRQRAESVLMTAEDTQIPIFTDRRTSNTPTPLPRAASEPPPLPPIIAGTRLGSSPEEQACEAADQDAVDTPMVEPRSLERLATVRDEVGEANSGPITSVEPARPRGKQRHRTRRLTSPATPLAKQPKDRRKVADGSGPHELIDEPASPPEIDARYLRGGDWVPARLRSLSLKSAYLVTGALPRPGDVVHLALGFRGTGAMISGSVYHVTTVEDAAHTGSSGFAVRFDSDDTPERRQLTELLKRARSAGVTIKPPPPRVAVRFPVEWPVRIGTRIGGIRGAALDVSSGGMFLCTERELTSDEIVFRMPLDNLDAGITGRARPVRRVDDQMALERGLHRGYGLIIVELSDLDERRWTCFLERVRRRSERRILVASARTRGRELTDGLRSSGYAVSLACDHTAVFELLRTGSRPPDVAVIDPSFVADVADRRRIESALATLAVPQVTPPSAVAEARTAVDRMLLSV